MEFTSSLDQANFMGYYPPPQNDSSHYPNGGWEYHQEMIDYEQSTQWGYAPESQNYQDNFIGYCPTPQNDSSHYANGGWEYQQGMMEYEHLPETQNEPYFNESNNYSCCSWKGRNQRDFNTPYSIHQETASFDCAVNTFMQDCSLGPQNDPYIDEYNNYSSCGWEDQNQRAFDSPYSIHQEPSSLESTFNAFMQNFPTPPPNFSFEDSSSLDYA
ncbi:hypothetical protein AHAS_Ahas14G0133400 [Arachis hypogaea]